MNSKPLVSIVIPTYNQREEFLRECIESAINQTYENIEIVISNNHSTNNAAQVIDEYAAKDERIKIVSPPVFLDLSGSFLYSFTQAKGEYYCYISSDDILMPMCIEALLEQLECNDQIVFAHGEALYFNKDEMPYLQWQYFDEKSGVYDLNKEATHLLLTFKYVCFGGLLVRRHIWENVISLLEQNNLFITHYLDVLLTVMLYRAGNVYFNNEVLCKVRMENETRNQKYSLTIDSQATMWNFLETDNLLQKKFSDMAIDIKPYKEQQFIMLCRYTIAEYLRGVIDFKSFNRALNDLKSFGLRFPAKSFLMFGFIRLLPGFSKLSFKLAKKIVGHS